MLQPSEKTPISQHVQESIRGSVHSPTPHESAHKHVTGSAVYTDDIVEPAGLLHVALGLSQHAHAQILKLDLSDVLESPGVVDVLTAEDIPGTNDFGHDNLGDDRIFSADTVHYAGQVLFSVLAESDVQARHAVAKAVVEYDVFEPCLDVYEAHRKNSYVSKPRIVRSGDSRAAIENSSNRIKGALTTGAQDHFYLEGQVAMALPGEDGDMHVISSTQDPTAVQDLVARVLDRAAHSVTVEVRRMGGAFGGKETLATLFASIAAIGAEKTGRPVKCRLDRDDDMKITGKRHEFFSEYDVGFDDQGEILGAEFQLLMRAGNSADQSPYILDRAVAHCDNAYFVDNITIKAYACRTNTVSACAFRGFGSPQAMAVIERVIDHIAFHLRIDPLLVRRKNLYGKKEHNITHFGGKVKHNILPEILDELEKSSDYALRRMQVRAYNSTSRWLKKGIALVPIKYGIGYGSIFLDQGSALIHVYKDGSVHLNHGGTEMGQGLYTKVAQVVAEVLQVDFSSIKVSSTRTDKVPNTSATAASSGTDHNAGAAYIAANKIKQRLIDFASIFYEVEASDIRFQNGRILLGQRQLAFSELASKAYLNRVAMSATGYYRTDFGNYDSETLSGNAHRYQVYGAAVAEVIIDPLTGEQRVTCIDVLHDVGKSLNEAIDYGQLEGGLMQGIGWVTNEEVVWDDHGILRTHAPSTYKIPTCSDRPEMMNLNFVEWSKNEEPSIFKSKAIAEPPFCLSLSVFSAIGDAIASCNNYEIFPDLNMPATPECILTKCISMSAK